MVDRPHVFVGVVVPVDGVVAIIGEAVGGKIAAGRHDAVVGRVDVAALAVAGERRGQKLHGALRASGTRADDAAEAGLDEVDRGQVIPADAGFRLRLVVVAQEFVGRSRRLDAPRGQPVSRGRYRGELPTGVDIAVVDIE